ncbi:tRNA (adenosine(37)-N6)-threonylcarbamoyltransferase complex transferase subunit TsaD [Prochlorococcus marinus]|uniref:tRNA N6-adenosine threonylcarbamoyltransferase n=1 Tax=Prochlorococcus marinus str. PAC1 TaxID=59924 RepID=A0A0A2BYY5_PROMR|nr:tRNA (adenosine(37)-N6)-threonylcarbamoyltransferase complex transferase subunit TsaD [Prochlorococcus marinus]KGG19306.1 TsaD/Kae1/Qri7 protein [Prochlorococcus marinus str. PAC1]
MSIILSLETSCDESAAALVSDEKGKIDLLANEIASQIDEHANWGGVVPEIASRRHLENLPFLIEEVFAKSKLQINDIDAVAATVTPGLAGSLLIGSITARTLANLHQIPFLGIHHLEGHLSSIYLSENHPKPPFLVLLVSGGHTELIKVDVKHKYQRLGRSHDDAAGEAFDKVARLLGLSYPGGPAIQKIAKSGDPKKFLFPKGRVSKPEGGFYPYDFSFSGLKTAVFRQIEKIRSENKKLPIEDIAASFEYIVAEVLVERSFKCALDQGLNSLVLVGGVAANVRLRKMMLAKASENSIDITLAPMEFCTDNAAMIGAAALLRLSSDSFKSSMELGVSARWPLEKSDLLYDPIPPF